MLRFDGFDALVDAPETAGCIATIGVFDGVHLGHFAVLRRTVERAKENGLISVVVTFDEHPKRVLLGRSPATVTSLNHRLRLFQRIGLDAAVVLRFTPGLREMSADSFLRQNLIPKLGLHGLVLGFDSKFGHQRQGNVSSLQEAAPSLGIEVEEVHPLLLDGRAVSSTAIREAVQLGEMNRAATMLGRPVSLLGTVIHGEGRGKTLGFPTANLDPHHELLPPAGVYSALVLCGPAPFDPEIAAQSLAPGVVNVGRRPTFEDTDEETVEVHLPEFDGDLYGQDLEVFLLDALRPERNFESPEALHDRISQDVQEALASIDNARRSHFWRIPGAWLPMECSRVEDFTPREHPS